MQEYVLSVKVANNEGVLLRVSSLFSRRCFNIKSLNAAETEVPEISRLTIVVAGDLRVLEQIKNQLMKLHDVKEVKILTDAEHVIVRAGRSVEDRRGIVEVANLFRAKSVDIAEDSIMLELTGKPEKIDSFISLLKPFGIVKMVRSGISALERD